MKTYTKTEAKKEISALVNNFEKNISYYKSSDYNEAQVKKSYIEPLFEFLNWNVSNKELEPDRQVFNYEVTGKTGSDYGKRPDYLIKIPDKKSNQMKSCFFIEAKKPVYDLKTTTKYIRQVYQYSYSTLNASESPNNRVRLALLTNFEQFRFFDCLDPTPLDKKYEEKYEAFNKHIIKDWSFKDYIDKFDELWDLFEYNNVVNGSLDKWYLTEKQISENRITPDKKFLQDLKTWRVDIAKSMYKNEHTLSDYQLTKATLLFINRIIFVKMLSDRNIEPDYLTGILSILGKFNKTEIKLYEQCQHIFIRLDHIYNSSMFRKDESDEFEIENRVLRTIFEELKPQHSIYTLAAMPVEIIGSVYELFIAEQIVKKGSGISLIPKYEDKKAEGVYYTPRYIVEYIVDNTLGKKLEECKTPDDVAKIKILDPACGSGSFLIVAYQKLMDWHKKWLHEELTKFTKKKNVSQFKTKFKKDARVIHVGGNDFLSIHLSHKLKSEILTNNIFGVDIDPQAVLVTMFSLSIKALEDSTHDEVIEDNTLYNMPALPILENNIKCGNSLIGSDFYIENRLSLFNEREKRKINTFDWDGKDGFPDIIKSGGFDVVIGNPPWGQKEMYFKDEVITYLKEIYKISSIGIIDLFRFFVEKSILLSKKNSYWGQVLPDIILLKNYASTRKFILDKIEIKKINHWGMAFEGVNIDACTILGINKKTDYQNNIEIFIKQKDDLIINSIKQAKFLTNDNYKFNLFLNERSGSIIKKMKSFSLFSDFFEPHEGIHSGNIRDKLFIDKSISKNCKKLIFGRDEVKRYYLHWNGKWVNYNKKIIDKDKGEYAGLGKVEYFENNKLVVRRTGDFILANIDLNNYYFSNNVFICPPKSNLHLNLLYILGILNSKFITWFYRTIQPRKGRLFAELKINVLKQLPIRSIDFSNKSEKAMHDKLVRLARQMLENQEYFHNSNSESDKKLYKNIIDRLDKEIDSLVYKLYDLTDDEIEIIVNG